MNVFTEVYDKSRQLLQTKCFDDRWSNIEAKVKALLAAGGFSEPDAPVLDLIRSSLSDAVKGKANMADALADEIIALSRPAAAGYQDRAALLKTLKHIYFVVRSGNQSLWVVDHPKDYDKWSYDKFGGAGNDKVKLLLKNENETYGAENRRMFSSALQLARKISMDVSVKLGNKDARTIEKVHKWFLDDKAKAEDLTKTTDTLVEGFKKISALCNSTTVIFSDRPHKRVDPDYATTKAAVNDDDKMPVIYIFQMFLDYGRLNRLGIRDQLWQCAKTIIHEMSHKLLGNDDIAYGTSGIKPGSSIKVEDAIKNADSWGIFAVDVAGCLPDSAATEAFK